MAEIADYISACPLLMYHLSIVIRISLKFVDIKSLFLVKDLCLKSTRYAWGMLVYCEFKLGSMLSFAIYDLLSCTML